MKSLNKTVLKSLMLCSIALSLSFVSNPGKLYAQTSQGTEFWIAFPANFSQIGLRELYITAEVNSVVDVNIVDPAFSTTINATAGTLTKVTLPLSVDVTNNGTIANKGIHVTSDNPVTVYAMSERANTSDAYLALPIESIGTDYFVLGYSSDASNLLAQMTIVATEDNTLVTITPTATGGGWTAGVTNNVTLNAGQVFQLRSGLGDYTGSRVISNKPVSVFGGGDCLRVPANVPACDILVQQIIPKSAWGQSFVTVPLAARLAGDIFRIIAQDAGTEVQINGALVATLNAGQFYETSLASNSYNRITANKPVLVGQYAKGTSADNQPGDPFFTLVPPDEQFLNNYIVSAGTAVISTNYLNITSPTSNIGNVLVNGATIPAGSWTAIPGTTFSGTQVPVSNGIHTVTSVLPIGLLVYGWGQADSYGYLGGQAFGAVATVASLTISPKTGSGPINTNRCWQATLLDSFGDPVTGVRVDFNITGPNSASSGFAFTNASGIATFCYDGPNPGTDNIMAVVGALNDSATFTWTEIASIPVSNWALYLGILLMITFVAIRFRRMI